jgi:hypothetical protein
MFLLLLKKMHIDSRSGPESEKRGCGWTHAPPFVVTKRKTRVKCHSIIHNGTVWGRSLPALGQPIGEAQPFVSTLIFLLTASALLPHYMSVLI